MQPDYRKPLTFPMHTREACLREAMRISHHVHCDQLDCSVSVQRQPTDLTPEQLLEMGLNERRTHYHFIRRDEAFPCDGPLYQNGYYDVGLSTIRSEGPDYFLWIRLTIEQGDRLIEKHGLYERKEGR